MDLSTFTYDNSKNAKLKSAVPAVTKVEPCILGIDEAGRGPVLGPMVYAAAYCPISYRDKLKDIGFADSKALTEEKREAFFKVIDQNNENIGWVLEIHSPTTISSSMLRRCKYNLNALSHDSAIELIKWVLELGVNVQEVYVDTVGVAEKYQAKLSDIFPDIKVTVAKQADATFPIVSAASICAKVARDDALKSWKFLEGTLFEGKEYGSGYPNDPITKQFLSQNVDPIFGYPQLVRFSWSTAEKILEKQAAEVTWDDDDDDVENSTDGSLSVLQFFKRKNEKKKPTAKSHIFFTERHLSQVVKL